MRGRVRGKKGVRICSSLASMILLPMVLMVKMLRSDGVNYGKLP